jgi:hypothetical protein
MINGKPTTEELAIAATFADFVRCFNQACREAGGGSWSSLKEMRLEDVASILARNGLRLVYSDDWLSTNRQFYSDLMAEALNYLPKENKS